MNYLKSIFLEAVSSFVSFTSSPWSCHWKRIVLRKINPRLCGLDFNFWRALTKEVRIFSHQVTRATLFLLRIHWNCLWQTSLDVIFFVYSQVYHSEMFTHVSGLSFFRLRYTNLPKRRCGANLCASATAAVFPSTLIGKKILRISIKICRITSWNHEETCLEDYEDLVIYFEKIMSWPWTQSRPPISSRSMSWRLLWTLSCNS